MTRALWACRSGQRVVVEMVKGGATRIDRLAAVGILPGVELRIQQVRPVVVVESDEVVLAIERDVASHVLVVDADADVGLPRAVE